MKYFGALIIVWCLFSSCLDTVDCINYDAIDTFRTCPAIINPVCGCDDITYPNDCIAQRHGVVSWIGGPCP